jgi:hypothetical protein
MKKIYLTILLMLLLPVTSAYAILVGVETGQQVLIPYSVVDGGWWSGVAIHNPSGSAMTFSIGVYKDDGTYVAGKATFTVAAHAMKVDLVENFFNAPHPTGRLSLSIRCSTGNAPAFQVTLFIGNDQGGFGFQNYTSWDWVHAVVPEPFDPHLPIVIPRWPIPTL